MDATELIEFWESRREEILKNLPPHLFKEFRDLGAAIRMTEEALDSHEGDDEPNGDGDRKRIPLAERKRALQEYLRKTGGATRGKILKDTGMPNGSLGALLQNTESFENKDGIWKTKE